ncbi:hypothetical protein HY375_03530 [Candidatus Berkelbacteria bacterium]|nr:hypothetical protein [Candidatus Berkelbacteria bacterium]
MYRRICIALAAALAAFTSSAMAEVLNSERVFETHSGTYRIVMSFGGYSTDPHATTSGGMRCDMIQTPDGEWHQGFPLKQPFHIQDILDKEDGQTYVLAHKGVFTYDGESKEFREVFHLPGEMVLGNAVIDRFHEVYASITSDFAGLLAYSEGAWTLISFEGSVGWVEDWEPQGTSFILSTTNGWEVEFNPTTNKFVTLGRTPPSTEESAN